MNGLSVHNGSIRTPVIVGLGCGSSPGSATEKALFIALRAAEAEGAQIVHFGHRQIMSLPLYAAEQARSEAAAQLIEMLSIASGIVIASPAYHGSISGAIKNAIDFIQDTHSSDRPYLTNLPIGLIAVAGGHQAAMNTLVALRSVAHALRGWPTPMGVALNSTATPIMNEICQDSSVHASLELVGRQVMQFIDVRLGLNQGPLKSGTFHEQCSQPVATA